MPPGQLPAPRRWALHGGRGRQTESCASPRHTRPHHKAVSTEPSCRCASASAHVDRPPRRAPQPRVQAAEAAEQPAARAGRAPAGRNGRGQGNRCHASVHHVCTHAHHATHRRGAAGAVQGQGHRGEDLPQGHIGQAAGSDGLREAEGRAPLGQQAAARGQARGRAMTTARVWARRLRCRRRRTHRLRQRGRCRQRPAGLLRRHSQRHRLGVGAPAGRQAARKPVAKHLRHSVQSRRVGGSDARPVSKRWAGARRALWGQRSPQSSPLAACPAAAPAPPRL